MTDNEIIKALGWLIFNFPRQEKLKDDSDKLCNCINLYCQNAIDLINRQKAEIERLEKEVDRLSQCVLYHDGHIADDIKEFADMVFELFPEDKQFTTISRFAIKHILKDLTENK